MLTQTGSVYFRDEDGVLWLSESFVDQNGTTTTQQEVVVENSNG
jgi:hypothetical protein